MVQNHNGHTRQERRYSSHLSELIAKVPYVPKDIVFGQIADFVKPVSFEEIYGALRRRGYHFNQASLFKTLWDGVFSEEVEAVHIPKKDFLYLLREKSLRKVEEERLKEHWEQLFEDLRVQGVEEEPYRPPSLEEILNGEADGTLRLFKD